MPAQKRSSNGADSGVQPELSARKKSRVYLSLSIAPAHGHPTAGPKTRLTRLLSMPTSFPSSTTVTLRPFWDVESENHTAEEVLDEDEREQQCNKEHSGDNTHCLRADGRPSGPCLHRLAEFLDDASRVSQSIHGLLAVLLSRPWVVIVFTGLAFAS